ncbi:MAG: MaoC/PaaZ C-terminal domain-containing protein [Myxococcota bacterium]|nr:MaoC/PaaZ C-terminal domain-containing protein [Myxococcota bacterium]
MALDKNRIAVGDEYEEVSVDDLSRTQIVMYAGASGDFQPLHSDETYARASGFKGTFAHGMLTMGLAGKALTNFAGPGALETYKARFQAQVWPGDTLTTKLTITEIHPSSATLALETTNQDGALVLTGTASAKLTT